MPQNRLYINVLPNHKNKLYTVTYESLNSEIYIYVQQGISIQTMKMAFTGPCLCTFIETANYTMIFSLLPCLCMAFSFFWVLSSFNLQAVYDISFFLQLTLEARWDSVLEPVCSLWLNFWNLSWIPAEKVDKQQNNMNNQKCHNCTLLLWWTTKRLNSTDIWWTTKSFVTTFRYMTFYTCFREVQYTEYMQIFGKARC